MIEIPKNEIENKPFEFRLTVSQLTKKVQSLEGENLQVGACEALISICQQ